MFPPQLLSGSNATHPAHGQIHHDDVRTVVGREAYRRLAVDRAAHDLQVRLVLDKRVHASADDGVVVHDQYADHRTSSCARRACLPAIMTAMAWTFLANP